MEDVVNQIVIEIMEEKDNAISEETWDALDRIEAKIIKILEPRPKIPSAFGCC